MNARFLSKYSIRGKLAILNSILIAIIAIFIIFYFPKKVERQEVSALIDKTHTIANMVSFSISPAMVFSDTTDARIVVEGALQNKEVVYVIAYDGEGSVFVEYDWGKRIYRDSLFTEALQRESMDDKICEIVVPIRHNDKIIGWICVGSSMEKIVAEITKNRLTGSLVGLTIFIFGLLAIFGISTVITKPLSAMVDTVRRISNGDLSQRTEITTSDEVGMLGNLFNRMVDNLETTKNDLENINRTLEQRVDDRTRSLQKEILERKRAEDELQRNVQRLGLVLRTVPMAFYTTSVIDKLATTWISPQILQITGFTPEQFSSDDEFWSSRIHPDDRENTMGEYRKVLLDGVSNTEYRWRCADGSHHWFYDQAILVRDMDGTPREIIGSWLDITERRAAEIAISEWKNRYELVVTSSGQIVYDYDLNSGNILWSGSMEQVLGYRIDDLRGGIKKWDELIHPDDRNNTVAILDTAAKSGIPFDVEYRFRHNDGTYRWFHDRGFFIMDSYQKAVRMLGVMEDTTKSRVLEEDLRKLSMAVEQSPASILITDTAGKIEYINPKFREVTGYTAEEVIGKNPNILKSGETPEWEYKRLWDTICTGEEWNGEFHNRKKNGELYWESVTISPIKDLQGKITHYLAVREDISNKKIFEAQMYRSQRLESIGTLAGGVAHDLNNVLSPILMAIQLLQSAAPENKKMEWLSMLQSSAERGASIVKQLLTFARGYEGEKILLQPKHLIREIEKIISETFPKNIRVSTEIARDLWTISGDVTQLHQVLMNLCVNARDAMSSGGRLLLKASNLVLDEHTLRSHFNGKSGPYVVISVEDTGIGIPRAIIDKIYDPFFTTKEIGKGTGLGLSTVLAIVKSHGGFIDVYSQEGQGTIFKVYLPASEVENNIRTTADTAKYPVGKGERILIVDDEAPIREVTKGILESYGYGVFVAEDGTEAIVQYTLHHDEIQLVITDMMMPNIDGSALIRTLQRIDPRVKIIATSGLAEADAIVEVHNNVVGAFIHKPYQAEKLLTVVHDVLNGKEVKR
jgi:two-component system, cell cycle sensor histidine kinase and response regulator CckA